MYYINIINSAIDDATFAMKSVEGEDIELDYGYSGIAEKRVAINPYIAVDIFFDSLYEHFQIENDSVSEAYLKSHVPAIAIVDYNGVYMYSIEKYTNINKNGVEETYVDHILKPKRYYSYMYAIKDGQLITQDNLVYHDIDDSAIYTVNFTMDDYIYVINKNGEKNGFYLEDNNNNDKLGTSNDELKQRIINHLKLQRSKTISSIISDEMSYSINRHNEYSDVEYEFFFPAFSVEHWEQMVDNIGVIAFVQGINIGNDVLNYTAHSISALKVTDRYYVSQAIKADELNYYHNTEECTLYNDQVKPITGYYLSKLDSASLGYYPCPVCNP